MLVNFNFRTAGPVGSYLLGFLWDLFWLPSATDRKDISMISYVILGITFLYVVIQVSIYASRGRKPHSREDIDEKLLAALNGGDKR